MTAIVTRLSEPPGAGLDWTQPPWDRIPFQRLRYHMGETPVHFPKTDVKVAYDAKALYVIFSVEDRYVRASAARHQDSVCRDSCVEFFFTPDTDISVGYFNIEVNCGGTMLFHFHPGPDKREVEIPVDDCARMIRAHSLPRIVDPEIQTPVTWTVEYMIPFSLLGRFCPVQLPHSGTLWRANFYKCADDTSHPHWLSWSPVVFPKPNFHLPRYFGVLTFA